VKLEQIKTFQAVTEQYENPQNVLSSFFTDSTISIEVAPDTEAVRNFTAHMTSLWKRYLGERPMPTLAYNYHASESDLVEFYESAPVDSHVKMALILPLELHLLASGNWSTLNEYTIRTSPDEYISLPPISTSKTGLETCRLNGESDVKVELLELPKTCPVNGYYYTHFLALQSLVDQTILELRNGKQVNLTLTMENYPKAEYTAGGCPSSNSYLCTFISATIQYAAVAVFINVRNSNPIGLSTFLRVLIPLYTVIPLAQLINNLLVLVVTEKEGKIKDGLKMVGVSDMAYWFVHFVMEYYVLVYSFVSGWCLSPN
jgi:hypothetical protein